MYYIFEDIGRTMKRVEHTLMLGGPGHLTVNREERSTNIIRYMEPISASDLGRALSVDDDIFSLPEHHTYNIMTFRINGHTPYFPNLPDDVWYSYMPDELEINIAIHESISNATYPNNDAMSYVERFQYEIVRRIYYNSQYQVFYFDSIFNDYLNEMNDFMRNKSKEVYRKKINKSHIKLDDNLFIL